MESESPDEEPSDPSLAVWSRVGLPSPPTRTPPPTTLSLSGASVFTFSSMATPTSASTPTPTSGMVNPTSAASSNPTSTLPRIGGIKQLGKDAIPFSGGGSLTSHRISEPLSALAYRPETDLRSIMRVEEACTRPLEEAKRIDEGASTVTFTQWTNDVKRHFADNGLDSVAYVLKPKRKGGLLPDINDLIRVERDCHEYYLFSEWGVLSKDDMDAWDVALSTSRCPMDVTNNTYARRYLRTSVGPVLRERIDRELPIDVSGARLLFFIIRKLQAVSAVSGRQLVEELQTIKLSAVAGCHVQDCAQKVHNVCTKLVGLGTSHIPADLPMLVAQCFDTTTVQAFDLEVTKIENDLDDDPTSHTWTSILDHLTAKFDTLVLTKRWPPLTASKTTSASGFAVQLEEVKKGLKDVKVALQQGSKDKPSSSGSSGGTTDRDLSNVECHYCHKKGHYKSSCPSLANKSSPTTPASTTAGTTNKPKHWTRTPPADSEPQTKSVTVEGKTILFKWCQTCKRWRSGPKAHLTTEHKKKNAPATTQAGNSLQSDGINFGLFPAETEFFADRPLPGGFLEAFYRLQPPPDASDDDADTDWNLVREGDGTPIARAKLRRPKGFAGQW